MPFAIPMIWREPLNHHDDCYFCVVNTSGFSTKNKHKIIYPNLRLALRPVVHGDAFPVPVPPKDRIESVQDEIDVEEGASGGNLNASADPNFIPEDTDTSPQTFNQEELNDLIRDLTLSKEKPELLASRLKDKHLLQKNVLVS